MSSATEKAEVIKGLLSTKCPGCDGRKAERKSVCRDCWNQLPIAMRAALYQGIGQGYELALANAVKRLRERVNQSTNKGARL